MKLNNLKPAIGAVKSSKRIGRGTGSGRGGTSTRGHKGAGSRSGTSTKRGFEGGQMPLQKRLPKYGFTSRMAAVTAEIRLSGQMAVSLLRRSLDCFARLDNANSVFAITINPVVFLSNL